MIVVRLILLIFICFSGISQAKDCTKLTASGNPEYPPYLWRTDLQSVAMNGAIARLTKHLGKQLGVNIELKYVGPWGRVQEEVAEGRIDLIAGAFYTQLRSYRMDYIRPAFQRTRTSVWVRKDKTFAYSAWSDLKDKAGVTVINNSFGQEFDEYAERHLDIHEAVRLNQGLKMLLGSRVDYFIYEQNPALAYASELGMLEQIKPLDHPVSSENLFLTFSKMSACNTPELRQRFADALQQIKDQQLMQEFLRLALKDWQQRSPK